MTIELNPITSGYSTGLINDNFQAVEDYVNNNLLQRDGLETGEINQMEVDLDMNSHFVYNLPEPVLEHQAARLQDIQNAVAGGAANLITFTPYQNISSSNLQAAVEEIIDDLSDSSQGGSLVHVNTDTGNQALTAALNDRLNRSDRYRFVDGLAGLKAIADMNNGQKAAISFGGRAGDFVFYASDQSANVSSDTQEGIYVAPGSDSTGASGAWVREFKGLADVRWFGAVLDNVADDTAAFNGALSVSDSVWFPVGDAYITDTVTVPNGKQLIGEGATSSEFQIKSDFNLGAAAVVQMGSSENTGILDKLGFVFEQPASNIRANMTQYPPAVGHAGIPRVRIGHIRISRGWDGIDASGNSGGATYDWIECGTLNVGLYIDGALDTMNIGRFRVWPFGMSAAVDAGEVYRDGNTKAALIGRCDGMSGEIHSFKALVDFTSTGGSSADRHLHSIHLDGDGARLIVTSGRLYVAYVYSTKTSSDTAASILAQSTGQIRIGQISMESDLNTAPIQTVTSGVIQIDGGRINHIRTGTNAAYHQSDQYMILRNIEMTAPGARTVTYIRGDDGDLVVQNCYWPNNGGTGEAIGSTAANTLYNNNNVLNGRTVVDT